ncbi:biotin--[acetyl-CoA-carboxylase] ligase [Zavarzinella formosa]|uniref:biotin--[acetyl-CoA-carboxylase] ligase n=1 Tax=Zavarzinella formosa TaxID=360055 RepID=UPI00035C87CC|nr:biotin--[acetyl-CoA-carboxylase] ligase [Zavarzinella formosa]
MSTTRQHIGKQHLHLPETDSTNNRAAELAKNPANAGAVVTAGVQTRGRGQYGRVWQSQPDTNVLMSVLLFPPPELRHPAILTAFAAVVVGEMVLQITGQQTSIKWPNDVLFKGKKICGILIESGVHRHGADSPQHFIVGIGLNVNQTAEDFAAQELPDACSLAMMVGRRLTVSAITEALLDNLDSEYGRLLAGEIAPLEACWKWRMGLLGKPVTVELMDGTEHGGRLRDMGFETVELEDRSFKSVEVRHVRSHG